ncbi:flagellin N-terminal helical domain-containing protein [Polynucleobacter sp.]|uniref:flagellin N-terminal helical domain-containing protein n=1 Tax=Polynucleobacter sp. TaxID=2029855 RepID=UPI003F69D0B9
MPTVINTNLASLFAQNSLSNAQNSLATSVQRLSSGLRINSAKDDAAGLSISQNMQSQINGTNQSIRNLSDATNLLQTADSSLSTVQDMMLRLKQLATQGYDGSLSTSQKLNIVQEMKDLNAEINATAARTAFNGINLLSSGSSVDLNNSDIKTGTRIQNTAVTVLGTDNTKGLGYYSRTGTGTATGLNDLSLGALGGVGSAAAGSVATTFDVELNSAMLKQIPGSYVLTSNGANLTLTGTFNGLAQSQTVAVKDAVASNVSGQATTTDQILDFSNFGISINMRSVRGTGDKVTGEALASQLASSTYKNLQVNGTGGEITGMNLSGVAPGTYTMTYNKTGAAVSLNAGLGQSIYTQPSTGAVAGSLAGVTFTGGSGSAGLTGTINYDASGNITTITTLGGTNAGFKAGDLLSASYATSLTTPTYSSRDGAGLMAIGSTATIVARDVKAGDVVRIEGKTFTATQNATADQVASVFRSATNTAGTALGFGTLSGAYTGSLATATPTGAGANVILTATLATVTNATTFDVTKTVSNIMVGQDVNFSGGSATLTMSGTVNGIATTQSLAVSANAALATQKFNFDSFGIAFDAKSYQAQTADQIGASLATLNAGVGQSVSGGPGQVVVASGNNSALKFQSGPNSDAYIQIDTLNIQTASTGQFAGDQLEMVTLGSVISESGAGKLGTLGLTDTIDTWQTAFKNAAAAVDNALEFISTKRATYGSQMNRLSYVSTNLQAQSTNLQNSRSAIIDTDFAAETAKLTKGQIMQQAATAMLAQANQMPNVILSLLK